MHKSKSTTCIGTYLFGGQRELPKVRNRFAVSVEEPLFENDDPSVSDPSNLSPASRKSRRGNMFGSPFTLPEPKTPEQTPLKPIPFGSYS